VNNGLVVIVKEIVKAVMMPI